MRKLLLGNEAVARGLYEAGCRVASSYPGTPSTEVTESAAKYDEIYCEWAPNEKVAMETAGGAAIAGARSFCGMKHVGLNVAADPLFTLSYTGVNAGMVIVVADDPGMHSSQNEQDSRNYAKASMIPMLEPADSQECLAFTKLAYDISERYDTPVIIRLTTRISHSRSLVEIGERVDNGLKGYVKDTQKYVMMPAMAKKKHVIVEERTKALEAWGDSEAVDLGVNKIEYNDKKIGIIAGGIACRKLGINVIGKEQFKLLGEYSQSMIKKVILGEENAYLKADINVPARPPVLCAGCPHRGLFYALKKLKVNVSGDIGCYTLGSMAPLGMMDTCICMGASVSALHGMNKADEAGSHKRVAVIGDSTFIHSGVTGLINIAYNQSTSVVVVLDNSITGMTGHQQNPTTGLTIKGDPTTAVSLEALAHAVGINRVVVVDPYDLAATEKAIKEELEADEPSVVISRRPCVLLKYVKTKPPVKVNTDKCASCKMCMKIGCPAISMKEGKAHIDFTLCVGCDVCKQLCKFGAIE